jgi:hypothetical protein
MHVGRRPDHPVAEAIQHRDNRPDDTELAVLGYSLAAGAMFSAR